MKKIKILFPILGITCLASTLPLVVSCGASYKYDLKKPQYEVAPRSVEGWVEQNATNIYLNEVINNKKILAEDIVYTRARAVVKANTATIEVKISKVDLQSHLLSFSYKANLDGKVTEISINDIKFSVFVRDGVVERGIYADAFIEGMSSGIDGVIAILNNVETWSIGINNEGEKEEFNKSNVESKKDLFTKICQSSLTYRCRYLSQIPIPQPTEYHYESPFTDWEIEPRGTDGWDATKATEIYLTEVNDKYEIMAEDFGREFAGSDQEGQQFDIEFKKVDPQTKIVDASFNIVNNLASPNYSLEVELSNVELIAAFNTSWAIMTDALFEYMMGSFSADALKQALNKHEGWSIKAKYVYDSEILIDKTIDAGNIDDNIDNCTTVLGRLIVTKSNYLKNVSGPSHLNKKEA